MQQPCAETWNKAFGSDEAYLSIQSSAPDSDSGLSGGVHAALSKVGQHDPEWGPRARRSPELGLTCTRRRFQQYVIALEIEVHNICSC